MPYNARLSTTDRERFAFQIEEMIDKSSVAEVIDIIGSVCQDKAEHLRANWQDTGSASVWERSARAIEKFVERFDIARLSC